MGRRVTSFCRDQNKLIGHKNKFNEIRQKCILEDHPTFSSQRHGKEIVEEFFSILLRVEGLMCRFLLL